MGFLPKRPYHTVVVDSARRLSGVDGFHRRFSRFGGITAIDFVCSLRSYAASVADCVVGYLARSDAPDPLSGSPAFGVCDAAASSSTFARIGPNGPYLCCSRLKPSTYGPYGVSIGFWSRIGKSLSRFAFSGRFWLTM